jgi:two-component system OmpR family sensor kinase
LRYRLLAILVALLLVALAVTGYGVQTVLRSFLLHQVDDSLLTASKDRGFVAQFFDGRPTDWHQRRLPTQFVVSAYVDGSAAPVAITWPNGISSTVDSLVSQLRMSSAEASAVSGRVYDVRGPDGSRWRATSFAVQLLNQDTGQVSPASVTMMQSLSGVTAAVRQLQSIYLLVAALVLAISGLLGWFAIRRAFVPLREVEDTAEAIAAGDLSRRIPEGPTHTEVGRLTSSLNGMLTQIEGAFRAREASENRTRRFAADASHELRTPLASIRGYAELYRQGAVPPPEVPRTMRRIEDEATRMGGLVEDLLLLARLDEQRPARTEPVDLLVLAGDSIHDVRALDPERRVRLVGLADPGTAPVTSPVYGLSPQPAPVIGDEDRLRQVVANLVGNAVRHTPEGSPIEVAVGVLDADGGGPRAVLEVRDHGPGLTPEQAERVFERFYRADPSRRRKHPGGGPGTDGTPASRPAGAGLGLSIVDAVVTAHRGEVSVRQTPGGGATFVVSLPAAP